MDMMFVKGLSLFVGGALASFYVFQQLDKKKAKEKERAILRLRKLKENRIHPELKQALALGEFSTADSIANSLSSDTLSDAFEILTMARDGMLLCKRWCDACPESVMAKSFFGSALIQEAWRVRGQSVASRVSDESFKDFFSLLGHGEALLTEAVEQAPSIADNYFYLLRALLGLDKREDADAVLQRAVQEGVDKFPLYVEYARLLTTKWLGSEGETLAFCRQVFQAEPKRFAGLIPYAHYEEYLLLLMGGGSSAAEYFKQESVKNEILSAYRQISSEPISVEVVQSLNNFACVFLLTGHTQEAKQALIRIGDHFSVFPWRYISGDLPEKAFLNAKHKVGLSAD